MERVYTTPLLDKLGIRPGMRVALIDIDDPEIRQLIAERTTDLTEGEPKPETDVVLFGAEAPADLAPLAMLASRIRPNGAIWVVSRKGKGGHPPLRRDPRCRESGGPDRQQGRVVLGDPHRAPLRHPGRAPTEVAAGSGTTALARARPAGQAVAFCLAFPCWRIRIGLPNGSRRPMSVP